MLEGARKTKIRETKLSPSTGNFLVFRLKALELLKKPSDIPVQSLQFYTRTKFYLWNESSAHGFWTEKLSVLF